MRAAAAIRNGLWICLAVVAPLQWGFAQSLQVYSELAEIDPFGNVTSPENPREILSPMIVRGGFTSFQIVVEVRPGTAYGLHIGQNPERAANVTLYREAGSGRLERADLPFKSDATAVFWMDVWADRDAPVRRIKIEPQLHIEPQRGLMEDWVSYPMEVRVMAATIPEGGASPENRQAVGHGRPDEILRDALCGRPQTDVVTESSASITRMRFRNAAEDVSLARVATRDKRTEAELKQMLGSCEGRPFRDPEAFLRIRDYLFRLP